MKLIINFASKILRLTSKRQAAFKSDRRNLWAPARAGAMMLFHQPFSSSVVFINRRFIWRSIRSAEIVEAELIGLSEENRIMIRATFFLTLAASALALPGATFGAQERKVSLESLPAVVRKTVEAE